MLNFSVEKVFFFFKKKKKKKKFEFNGCFVDPLTQIFTPIPFESGSSGFLFSTFYKQFDSSRFINLSITSSCIILEIIKSIGLSLIG
jgi:hypothetical protein